MAILLIAQLLVVSLGFDAFQSNLLESGEWFAFLAYAGQFAKMLVAVLVFVVLGLWPRLPSHLDAIDRAVTHYPYRYIIAIQLFCYAIFIWFTSAIFGTEAGAGGIDTSDTLAWIVTLILTGGLWLLALAPPGYWRKLLVAESRVLAAAVGVGGLAWLLASFAQNLWTPLSELTFHFSAALLGLLYPDIIVDPELKRLGAQGFVVNIAPQCSGYEGMGLMAIFTGFYLTVFRRDFRFPQALWLFPIGIVTIWLFNNVRIAALIAIGASFSPAVAIGGFHSQAGWISFIAVIGLTLTMAYRAPFFNVVSIRSQPLRPGLNLPMALLLPFVVLLAATILTSALSAEFDWLYPLRVITVALTLAACWRIYRFAVLKFNFLPWLAGVIVFGVWLVLVPDDAAQNAIFEGQLLEASQEVLVFWLLMRSIGAVVTVPIAEELLFRGYLLSRLAHQEIILEGRIAFSWAAIILSSILFGVLHAQWVAGIVAGVIYGLVRYRSESIKDAIIAHACTNFLLSIYVISTGSWSLW